MASRPAARPATPNGNADARDRWRRRLLVGQGIYYALTGLWPLLHFTSFARVVALPINPFQSQAFAAVILVIGASLIEAARREPPGPFPTLLAAGVAGAIAIVDLVWLPRLAGASGLWVDLVLEVAIAITLVLLFPRTPPQRPRTRTRWTP